MIGEALHKGTIAQVHERQWESRGSFLQSASIRVHSLAEMRVHSGPVLELLSHKSLRTTMAVLRPLAPKTPPPGWVEAPVRYRPSIGVR